jgi:hypothetical protein|tara:strand:+ start:298 stop:678 length:381 start_codon:yes stop_codon:yes gene_type:complete
MDENLENELTDIINNRSRKIYFKKYSSRIKQKISLLINGRVKILSFTITFIVLFAILGIPSISAFLIQSILILVFFYLLQTLVKSYARNRSVYRKRWRGKELDEDDNKLWISNKFATLYRNFTSNK